jgi:transcriptional regulator with XRE-family HTH domain
MPDSSPTTETPAPVPEGIGERLRQLRIRAGLQQSQLAKLAGVTKLVVSRHETGRRQPSEETAARYADVLGVSVAYLRGGAESEPAAGVLLQALRATTAPVPVREYVLRNPLSRTLFPDVWLELLRRDRDFWEALGGDDLDQIGVDMVATMLDVRARKRLSLRDESSRSGSHRRPPESAAVVHAGGGSGGSDARLSP